MLDKGVTYFLAIHTSSSLHSLQVEAMLQVLKKDDWMKLFFTKNLTFSMTFDVYNQIWFSE